MPVRVLSGSARRAFGQNALQCPTVHAQATRRLGNVAAAQFIDALDVLPTHAVGGHRVFRQLRVIGRDGAQGRIDIVGVDSILGEASLRKGEPAEARVHVSARCADAEIAQIVEDEVYALTLSGPAGGGSVRSERRPRMDVVDGFIDRAKVDTAIVWENL